MAEHLKTFSDDIKPNYNDTPIMGQHDRTAIGAENYQTKNVTNLLATLDLQYFKAVSFYRRRNYEKCIEICTEILQKGHENNVQIFTTPLSSDIAEEDIENQRIKKRTNNVIENDYNIDGLSNKSTFFTGNSNRFSSNYQNITAVRYKYYEQQTETKNSGRRLPTRLNNNINNNNNNTNNNNNSNNAATTSHNTLPMWMMEGVWQLKMCALTQRVFLDDLDTNVTDIDMEFERIATKSRPESAVITDLRLRNSVSRCSAFSSDEKIKTKRRLNSSTHIRPTSAIMRPITGDFSRPITALDGRPSTRCSNVALVRATSAKISTISDPSIAFYQASRLNPTIYAERKVIVKSLFQFLYYHEADVEKAYSLCTAVLSSSKYKATSSNSLHSHSNCDEWWWLQQIGRCLLNLCYPRKAEINLQNSLLLFSHPDTYLLLSRLYQSTKQPQRALDLMEKAIAKYPFDVNFRLEQSRLLDILNKVDESVQICRLITRLNPVNIDALACIAFNYFYDNNPEMALMYYRRILFLGFYSTELYCNMGLCCLYGGQIDLVLPCFQRALATADTVDQKADIWYNLSFVAIKSGDFKLAKRCLNLCLKNDTQNGAALNNLGVIMAKSGNILKAKSYINAAKEMLPSSLEIENNCKFIESHYKL